MRRIGSEARSRVAGHGPQWAVAPRDYYFRGLQKFTDSDSSSDKRFFPFNMFFFILQPRQYFGPVSCPWTTNEIRLSNGDDICLCTCVPLYNMYSALLVLLIHITGCDFKGYRPLWSLGMDGRTILIWTVKKHVSLWEIRLIRFRLGIVSEP